MSTTTLAPPAPRGARLYWALSDSLTLIGRSLRHSLRSVDALIVAVVLPVLLLLMFVEVFGGAISTGGDYVDWVVPAIVLLCAGFGSAATAVTVNDDITSGVVDRFRSLPIVSSALLTGHVLATVARCCVSTLLVLAAALLVGFQPAASALDWLAASGLVLLFMGAIAWPAAGWGLVARNAETAGAFSFVVMFLPYVSSAFVPVDTMPAGVRWVAERQPMTPLVDTLRGLLTSAPVDDSDALLAVGWCAGLLVAGAVGAAWLYRRRASA